MSPFPLTGAAAGSARLWLAELRQPCWGAPHLNVPSFGYFSGYTYVSLADIPLGIGVFPPQHVQTLDAFLFSLEAEYPGTPAIVQGLAQAPSDLSSHLLPPWGCKEGGKSDPMKSRSQPPFQSHPWTGWE